MIQEQANLDFKRKLDSSELLQKRIIDDLLCTESDMKPGLQRCIQIMESFEQLEGIHEDF